MTQHNVNRQKHEFSLEENYRKTQRRFLGVFLEFSSSENSFFRPVRNIAFLFAQQLNTVTVRLGYGCLL